MSDVYYNPEKCGLTKIAAHDFSDGDYQFDYRVVWADGEGRLWTARDSGCSCPSPFEDYSHPVIEGGTGLDRLTSIDTLRDEYRREVENGYKVLDGWDEFRAEVEAALDRLRAGATRG